MMDNLNTISEQIKNFRKLKNITQTELSEKTGISVSTIKKYEAGFRNPKYEQLAKIATALGIDVNTFFAKKSQTPEELASIIMKLDAQTGIEWTATKDETGKYIADSISLKFTDPAIAKNLAAYLNQKEEPISIDSTLEIDGVRVVVEKQ